MKWAAGDPLNPIEFHNEGELNLTNYELGIRTRIPHAWHKLPCMLALLAVLDSYGYCLLVCMLGMKCRFAMALFNARRRCAVCGGTNPRTSIDHLSSIYGTAIEYLSNIYGKHLRCRSRTYRAFIKHRSNIYGKPIENVSNIYGMPIGYL